MPTTYSTKNKFSKFVRINDYCLAEYIYYNNNDSTSDDEPDVNHFLKLINNEDGTYQLYNDNSDYYDETTGKGITKNIKANLGVRYNNGNVCMYDKENDIIEYTPETLIESYAAGDKKGTISVYMDTVRFHFMTGYVISSHDAVIMGVKARTNYGKYVYLLSSYLNHTNYDSLICFNPTPIYISDEKYDRYIDFKIPSVQYVSNQYYFEGNKETAVKLTGSCFVKDTPIIITFDECNSTNYKKEHDHTYTLYNISEHYEASISQYNEYTGLTAEIHEAEDGNYFLYGLESTDYSINSWFNRLNTEGDKWSLIHQLNVYEHLGNGETIEADTVTIYQSKNFEEFGKYRPVVTHTSNCVMITIDYMCRILNESTGEQIIRMSGAGTRNVNAYGKNTLGINNIGGAYPYKIYNKIYKTNISSTEMFEEPSFDGRIKTDTGGTVDTVRLEYPVYIDRNLISVTNDIITSQSLSDEFIVYNQYDLWLLLDKMENTLKFSIYRSENGNLVPLDMTDNEMGVSYRIVFNIDDSFDMTIDAVKSDSTSLSNGEIMFNLTSDESKQILVSTSNDFYIVAYNYSTMKNTVLYKGFWVPSTKYDEYKEHVAAVRSAYGDKFSSSQKLDALSESLDSGLADIPGDVQIPGFVDTGNNTEKSSMRS